MYKVTVTDTEGILPQIPGPNTEYVAARSIRLSHRGGDRLDAPIIGASLAWTFIGLDCRDGKYSALFTGSENRFLVSLSDQEDNVIWEGFLLPDAYQEPYRNYVQDVSFEAVDGLGRLRGKHLTGLTPEVSVVDVISRILRLTGLEKDLRFSPSIVNFEQKDFKQIWLSAESVDGVDAHGVLSDLASSLGASVYQADNVWNFEGWISRNQRTYLSTTYNSNGTLLAQEVVNKNVKEVQTLEGGNIGLVPPYGRIVVRYNKAITQLSEELSSMGEQKWADYEGAADKNEVYADAWTMDPDTPMLASKEKGVFYTLDVERREPQTPYPPTEEAGVFTVKNRPYVEEGAYYRLNISLRVEIGLVDPPEDPSETTPVVPFSEGNLEYLITIGGEAFLGYAGALSSNVPGAVQVETTYETGLPVLTTLVNDPADGESRGFEFQALNSGLFDVKLYRKAYVYTGSYLNPDDSDLGPDDFTYTVYVDSLSLERIGDVETEEVAVIDNSEEFTSEKDVDLTFSGDPSGVGPSFRLDRVETASEYETFVNSSRRHFPIDGRWFYIVDLKTAHLVDRNIDRVFDMFGNRVQVEDVAYNWLLGQEHVIITETRIMGTIGVEPPIRVQVPVASGDSAGRVHWDDWGSSLYQIERKPFVEAHADLLFSLFGRPVVRAAVPLWENVKINDILQIDYNGVRDMVVTDCVWDVDAGRTDVVASTSTYDGASLPPIVEIVAVSYQANDLLEVVAEGISPAGDMVSYEWVVVDGEGVIASPDNPATLVTVDGLVHIRVEATDNYGNVAVAEAYLYERVPTGISPPRTTYYTPESSGAPLTTVRVISITSEAPEDYVLNVNGWIDLSIAAPAGGAPSTERFLEGDSFELRVNGDAVVASDLPLEAYDVAPWSGIHWRAPFSINVRVSDTIELVTTADAERSGGGANRLFTRFETEGSSYVVGAGVIAGPPQPRDRPDPRPGTRPGRSGGGGRRG